MANRLRPCLALAILGLALLANLAQAAPVQIDPPSLANSGVTGIAVQQPMGQSFIANGDAVHTVDLRLLNLNLSFELSQDHFITLDLFEGIGFGGPLLTRKTVDVDQILGRLLGTEGSVAFALGGVPVTAGQAYSFQLSAATVRFGSRWFSGNRYADGQAILQGQAFDDPDLYFGISAVPEPASAWLLAAGLLLLGLRGGRANAGSVVSCAPGRPAGG